jgi:hypothetical protein
VRAGIVVRLEHDRLAPRLRRRAQQQASRLGHPRGVGDREADDAVVGEVGRLVGPQRPQRRCVVGLGRRNLASRFEPAAFVYFFPPGKSPEATSPEPAPPSIQAAIGRDVTGSTITAGSTTNSDCAPKPK